MEYHGEFGNSIVEYGYVRMMFLVLRKIESACYLYLIKKCIYSRSNKSLVMTSLFD